MAVITYNDQLRRLLANVRCVLAFDTAADFLGLTNGGYEQIITESLANYYEENNESFDGLVIPAHLRSRFEKYRVWAIGYYEE